MFPNIILDDINFLFSCMIGLINVVNQCHFREEYNIDEYRIKLTQNNNRYIKWLLTSILPFINTNRKSYDEITSLASLYTLKVDTTETKSISINEYEPKYIFTNVQYSRHGLNPIQEVKFDYDHILQNLYLFFESIRLTRNKLHVNWVDIIPIKNSELRTNRVFKELDSVIKNKSFVESNLDTYTIENFENPQSIQDISNRLKGINVDDIYDIISNDFYENVINYKFFIFDVHVVYKDQDRLFPLITILNHLYDIKSGVIDKQSDVDYARDSDYKKMLMELVTYSESNQNYKIEGGYIPNESIKIILKSIVLFFDRKYRNNKLSGYVSLRNIRENIDDYDESMKGVSMKNILTSAKTISNEIFEQYMMTSIRSFFYTVYSNFIFKVRNNSLNRELESFSFSNFRNNKFPIGLLTLKNLYNFSKSLVHIRINSSNNNFYSDTYQRLPRYWKSLSRKYKDLIIERLNRKSNDWFVITNNIRRVRNNLKFSKPITDNKSIREFNSFLYTVIFSDLSEIIVYHLIRKGILTKLIPRNKFTDRSNYDLGNIQQNQSFIKNITKDISKYSDTYYYLTSGAYEPNYFNVVSNPKLSYITYFAFEWVSQLLFYHKFLNNRVNFITASTGAGKSTQLPKLFLYGLVAFDYNNGGTVLLTAPRTNAVKGLAKRVSEEMGVDHDNGYYYVQYKYAAKNNMKNGNFPKIRYVTDGSVINDMIDPLMIPRYSSKGKYFYGKEQKNKYDIIMVDEAHEHNANMDFILSMVKSTIQVNNSIRLSIVSATIDDDEPIYRRFYRDIDDNRKYPLHYGLLHDRINVDRRLHLSPPDQTTRFKVYEEYRPNTDILDLVKLILTKRGGDVLIFETGKKSINNLVTLINDNTPDNVISIPYYADLSKINSQYENLIKDINTKKSSIPFSKKDMKEFNYDDLINRVGVTGMSSRTYSYDRVFIVSTNVAEASITIGGLKYVIETGKEKIGFFDYTKETNIILENFITDASRLQRKGRVGRSSEGYVYYTYEKGFLLNNRKKFNIAIQDLSNTFISLLSKKNDEKIINDSQLDMIIGKSEGKIDIDNPIDFFIQSHYFIFNDGYEFFTNKTVHNDIDRTRKNFIRSYYTGYDKNILLDSSGIFYVIHPEELNIQRNIYGKIIKSINNDDVTVENNIMLSNKMIIFWKILIDGLMIGIDNGKLYKTEYAEIVMFLIKHMQFINIEYIKLFVWMYGLIDTIDPSKLHNLICIISFLQTYSNSNIKLTEALMDVSEYEKAKIEIEEKYEGKEFKLRMREFKKTTKKAYSRSQLIVGGYIIESDLEVISNYMKRYYNYSIYESALKKSSKYIYITLDMKTSTTNLLDKNTIKKRMEIKSENGINIYENSLTKLFSKMLSRKISSENQKFNENLNDMIKRVYKEIIQIKLGIFFEDINFEFEDIRRLLSGYRKLIKGNVKFLTACQILSNPRNITRHISDSSVDGRNKYVLLRNPSLMSISTIPYTSYYQREDTFINESSKKRYLLFLNHNINSQQISILSLVRLKDLKLIMNIFNSTNMKSKLSNVTIKDEREYAQSIKNGLVSEKYFDRTNAKSKLIIFPDYYNTLKKIYSELDTIYDKNDNIWKVTKDLGFGLDEYY